MTRLTHEDDGHQTVHDDLHESYEKDTSTTTSEKVYQLLQGLQICVDASFNQEIA